MQKLQKFIASAIPLLILLSSSFPTAHAGSWQLVDNESRVYPAINNTFTNDAAIGGDFAVDGASNLDQTTIDTTDGALSVSGSNSASFDVAAVFNESGADKDFRVEGDTDANTFFVDASTNSIGLGTSTPGYKLDVKGSAAFGDEVTQGSLTLHAANSGNEGGEFVLQSVAGGVAGPSITFDMYADDFRVFRNDADAANSQFNIFQAGAGGDWKMSVNSTSAAYTLDVNGPIRSGSNGTDGQMRIYSEQGVTDYEVIFNPNAAMTQNTTYTLPADDGGVGEFLQTDGSGALTWAAAGGGSSTLDDAYNNDTGERTITMDDGDISIDGTSTHNFVIDLQGTGDFNILDNGASAFSVNDSGNMIVDGNTFNVVASTNRVGVGTASPSTALDVVGGLKSTGGIDFNASTYLYLPVNSDFTCFSKPPGSIKVNSINYGLDVCGASGFYASQQDSLGTAYANGQTITVGSSGDLVANLTSTQDFLVKDNGTTYATFDDSGNVTLANDLMVDTDTLVVDSSADGVGFGTTAPSAQLHVNSDASIGSAMFGGFGLDDMTTGGTFTGGYNDTFSVIIDGTGTPDTFQWSGGGSGASGVSMTGSAQTLVDGVTITFAATTGHTFFDSWSFTVNTTGTVVADNGKLGVGTTSPNYKVEIYEDNAIGGSTMLGIVQNNSAGDAAILFDGLVDFAAGVNASSNFVIANSNYLSSSTERLTINNSEAAFNDSSADINFRVESNNNTTGIFLDAGTDRVGVMRQPTTFAFEVNGDAGKTAGGPSWQVISDKRLKTNISEYTSGLDQLKQVQPINFEFNGLGPTEEGDAEVGFIAQEIENIFPNTISIWEDYLNPEDEEMTQLKSLNASELQFTVINALHDLDYNMASNTAVDSNGDVSIGMSAPRGVRAYPDDGGSLTAGTYYYKITAIDGGSNESAASEEFSTYVDGTETAKIVINWAPVSGASSYRVYKGTTSGNQTEYFATGSTTYTDDGTAGTSGSVPSSSTADTIRLSTTDDSWFTGGNIGVGTKTPNSLLELDGSFAVRRTASATNYNSVDEVIIGITDTSSARTVQLSSSDAVTGRILIVKDESGAASTNNITISTEGAETIDGQNTVTISADYGSAKFYSDGSDWFSW